MTLRRWSLASGAAGSSCAAPGSSSRAGQVSSAPGCSPASARPTAGSASRRAVVVLSRDPAAFARSAARACRRPGRRDDRRRRARLRVAGAAVHARHPRRGVGRRRPVAGPSGRRGGHDRRGHAPSARVLPGARRRPVAVPELRGRLPAARGHGTATVRGRFPRLGDPRRRALRLPSRQASHGVTHPGNGGSPQAPAVLDRQALLVRRPRSARRPAFRHRQLHRRCPEGRAGGRARGRHAGALLPLRRRHGGLAVDDTGRRPTGKGLQRRAPSAP